MFASRNRCVSFSKGDRDKKQEEATEKLKRQLPPARTKSTIQSNTLSFCLRRQSPRSGKVRSREMKGQRSGKWKVERRRKAPQRMITMTSGTQESDLLIFK